MPIRTLLFVLALLASLVVFFMPASGVPSAPPGTDKMVHGVVFLVLTATGLGTRLPRPALLLGLIAYAGLTEVLQESLPIGRSGDPWDVLADLVGVGVAWAATALLGGRASARRS